MTRQRERQLSRIKREIEVRLDLKYRKGQKSHGDDLFRRSLFDLLEEALDEVTDLVTYLLTIRQILVEGLK